MMKDYRSISLIKQPEKVKNSRYIVEERHNEQLDNTAREFLRNIIMPRVADNTLIFVSTEYPTIELYKDESTAKEELKSYSAYDVQRACAVAREYGICAKVGYNEKIGSFYCFWVTSK